MMLRRWFRLVSWLAWVLSASAAQAEPITADRPGIGSDPEVVPQFTLQGELGTDTREVRLGLLHGLEIDRDDADWAAKVALVDHDAFKLSLRGVVGDDGKVGFEVPASLVFSKLFSITTDVIWTRAAQTYSAEFNFNPTRHLTISPIAYYDTRARAALFAAWIPPGHDNLQFDIGYDQRRVVVGISTALDLGKLLHKAT